MDRILRTVRSHREAEVCDRDDLQRLSIEERISAVEQLRRVWFGEAQAESRVERVLSTTSLEARKASSRRRECSGRER
jgi:hypothetical protein